MLVDPLHHAITRSRSRFDAARESGLGRPTDPLGRTHSSGSAGHSRLVTMAATPGSSTSAPTIYCRICGYDLEGLPEPRCPECGKAFDPQNPDTFSPRPPQSPIWRWARRGLVVSLVIALALTVLLVVAFGLLYLAIATGVFQP